jgi:subtilisin family serine protease
VASPPPPRTQRRPPSRRAPLRRFAAATVIAFAAAAPAAHAEAPTPQAIDAHAEFLAYAGAPARPGKVCVVDTGVDLTTDVAANVEGRYSLYPGTLGDVGTVHGKHGTYVAGTIASPVDNQGSVGIWPRAKVISVRVFRDSSNGTTTAAYILALNQCRADGATVINLSLSGLGSATGPELDQLESRISDLRTSWGINVVAAAGNTGGEVGYPAAFPAAFAVAANDANGALCSFSARGPQVDIATLGCGVWVSMEGGGYGLADGTSFAAPIVSATLAALRAYSPTPLTPAQAEQLLIDAARTTAAGKVLDVAAAFRAAGLGAVAATPRPPDPPRPTATASSTPAPVPPVIHYIEAPPAGTGDPLADLGVGRPRVRSAGYRRGVLSVAVSGVPDFGTAMFSIGKRRYTRASGLLRLKLKQAPKRVSVLIDVPDVGRTAAVMIKVKRGEAAVQRRR